MQQWFTNRTRKADERGWIEPVDVLNQPKHLGRMNYFLNSWHRSQFSATVFAPQLTRFAEVDLEVTRYGDDGLSLRNTTDFRPFLVQQQRVFALRIAVSSFDQAQIRLELPT